MGQLKQEIRELSLWCSSCMVAFDADRPVGVLIGCKRPPHTLVLRLAVHPDHLRHGHGRHMLSSLSAKLAILGPPRMVVEIEAANVPALALFEDCGFLKERTYVDLVCDAPIGSPAPAGLVVPVTPSDLVDAGLPSEDAPRAWTRTRATLFKREGLSGLAIASGERIDASVLYASAGEAGVAIWCLFAAPDADGEKALGALLREVAHRERRSLLIPTFHEAEAPLDLLRRLRFTVARETIGLLAETPRSG